MWYFVRDVRIRVSHVCGDPLVGAGGGGGGGGRSDPARLNWNPWNPNYTLYRGGELSYIGPGNACIDRFELHIFSILMLEFHGLFSL